MNIAPPERALQIQTDSMYIINALIDTHRKWEDKGWLNIPNADLFRMTLYLLWTRQAPTWIQKVEAHVGIKGNEAADKVAKAGLEKEEVDDFHFPALPQWEFNGARLSALSFHELYEWVIHLKTGPRCQKVIELSKAVRKRHKHLTGDLPFESHLWASIRGHPSKR